MSLDGTGEKIVKVVLFESSLSCWRLQIAMKELQVPPGVVEENIDLFSWSHLSPSHLALAPLGEVPVLVTDQGRNLTGQQAISFLDKMVGQAGGVRLLPGAAVNNFLHKLEEVNMGAVTYGLSFHTELTSLLRYPYSESDFIDKARDFVLSRGDQLEAAAGREERLGRPEVAGELVRVAEKHRANLASYLEVDQFSQVLRTLHQLLDFFEAELGRDGRTGLWLGGAFFSIADITLGLYLHRTWQLGLEKEFYEEGVRPNLSVFYQRIRERPAFIEVTGWKNHLGQETKVKRPEDEMVDHAKVGLIAGAVLGGLYLVKKLIKK